MLRRTAIKGRPDGDFYCPKCQCRRSIRENTIFRSLHLSPELFCQIVIHWLGRDPRTRTATEVDVSYKTVSNYAKMLLIATYRLLEQRSQKIGGPGRVVEIDECLLHRRKYNRGRTKESGWVVGGIERPRTPTEKPRMFLERCPDRSKETLQQLIHKWVLPGTLILTDSFTSYRSLEDSGE